MVKSGQEIKNIIKKKPKNPCNCILCKNGTNCTTSNIVYKATCKHCNEDYLGASGRPSGVIFREHGASIRKKDTRSSLSIHLKEKHPRNAPRTREKGTAALDHKCLLNNYTMSIISKQKDQLATYLVEGLEIQKQNPKINGMSGNGFIR